MSAKLPVAPCECGHMPVFSSHDKFQRALAQHRSRSCKLRRADAAILSPRRGRFDSAAALDALHRMWR